MMTDSRSRDSEQARPGGVENLRKRSIEDSLATSQGLVGPVAAATTGAEAIVNNVQGSRKRRSKMPSSGGSGEGDPAHAGIRPPSERFAGEERVSGDMAKHRRRSTRQSLTDNELQQVLGHLTDANGPSSKRRGSVSTTRAVLVGSTKSLGLERTKPRKSVSAQLFACLASPSICEHAHWLCDVRTQEDMRKFMEHVAHQPKATYVPIACAEKILKEAETAAEEARSRHHNAISTLEATYRAIDEKTKRHYESLILHLQREAGRQLLLMVNEKKEQDEVVESLRDMIASLTAAAAAQERRHVAMRERDRLEREREAAEFCVMKAELAEENMRALEAVSSEAEQSVERVEAGRLEESRRRSLQRVELESKAARATVSLVLERIVRAVEGREESQGRAALADSLSTVRREADELRMQLEQALLASDTMRGETDKISKERDDVRAENLTLKAKLEAVDEQQKQEHAPEAASSEHTELSRVATELEEAKIALAKQRKNVSVLAGRLELSDKKKTFLRTAVEELQETVAKMLADAALPSSPDGTASAARGETEKEGAAELEQIQAKLQETIAGFERFGEEAGPRENELEAFTDTDFSGERRRSSMRELDITQRELENLREREKDARGEADGMVEAVDRARASQEQQQGREAELVSELEALEDEREMLSRGVIMAQERAALAMELVEAHTEEAAKARQESALNAAKFRRVSREIPQPIVAAALKAAADGETASLSERALGKIHPSAGNRRTAEQLRLASATLVEAIKEGSDLWRRNKREECHSLYAKAGIQAAGQMPPGQALDDLTVAMTAAKGMGPVKAAIALRKAFDTVIEAAMEAKENVAAQRLADRTSSKSPDGAGEEDIAEQFAVAEDNSKVASLKRQLEAMLARQTEMDNIAALAASTEDSKKARRGISWKTFRRGGDAKRCSELEAKVEELQALLDAGPAIGANAGPGGTSASQKRTRTDQDKITSLEKKNKEEAAKAKKLEAQIAKLEAQISSGAAHGDSSGSKGDSTKIKGLENKIKKVTEESERKIKRVERDLEAASKGWDSCKAELSDVRKERDDLRKEVEVMGSMGEELQILRVRDEEATRLQIELDEATASTSRIQKLYQEEQVLRKKYWNMMEDMKGKIRVYARCRPFAQYEISRNCKQAVRFLDETTVEVDGHHGAKQFVFDNVFTEEHNQEAVFQETKNLVQSALDGFNVCVFAYGQTGSGKTWTMTGGKEEQRGLSPRVVEEIFANIKKSKSATEVQVSCYFIELYLDNLRDLFFAMDHPNGSPPKLEIKLDANKMVVVKNVVIKEVNDAKELLHLFTQGNHQRKVGGTKMNAESSRSHSIFSILLEAYNRTTKKSTSGKFSLVDLAGSERADKTGATADRLKEAQSINKSLSALGDVISALSTNEKFIPYRNNKLTQVMQDSLGGNAKTLMFVNISPADYNQDETVTALTYATRVKLITNTAEKQQDGEEVARLKEIIRKLKAGERQAEKNDDE